MAEAAVRVEIQLVPVCLIRSGVGRELNIQGSFVLFLLHFHSYVQQLVFFHESYAKHAYSTFTTVYHGQIKGSMVYSNGVGTDFFTTSDLKFHFVISYSTYVCQVRSYTSIPMQYPHEYAKNIHVCYRECLLILVHIIIN